MSGILKSVSAVRIFVDAWGGTLTFPRDPAGNILTLVG
jgi:hypothetical protein